MSVVVDSSVWCHVWGKGTPPDDPQVRKLLGLVKQGPETIALLGVILQEVLQGLRDERQFARAREQLEEFPLIALDRQDYVAAANLRHRCQTRGVQAGTVDLQIAAACLQHDCALLTCDADFSRIAACCPLQLL
jgi:predicted nucleic acid-binding protein